MARSDAKVSETGETMQSFSIVITACNCGPVIRRTLQSVEEALAYFRQADGRWRDVPVEVVLVDDGSTDNTLQTVSEFIRDPGTWKVVRRTSRSNPSCARNVGVRQSSGDLLFFLDGDDLYLPSHLHDCYQALQDPAIDFVKTGVRLADPVHPDWRPRIETSVVINLCIRRRCHEFFGGFPDYHLFKRTDDQFQPVTDVFHKIEDMYYNQLASQLFRGRKAAKETVEYCRYPGNSFDRQYEKFQRPFGQYQEVVPEKRQYRLRLGDVIILHQVETLKRQRLLPAGEAARTAPAELLAVARRYHQAGDLPQAQQTYRQALQREPGNALAWYLLGAACQATGHSGEAESSLRQALRYQPDHADAHNQLGVVLAQQGRFEEAVASFGESVQHKPHAHEALTNLGLALKCLGRPEEALLRFQEALRLQPDHAKAQHYLTQTLREQGKLAAFAPGSAEAANAMGLRALEQEKGEEAVAHFQEALRLRPTFAEAHNHLGMSFWLLGRYAEAEASCRQATRFRPNSAESHSNLGLILKELNRLDEAEASLREALRLKPEFAPAYNNLSIVLWRLGRWGEAESLCREALRLKPDFAEAWNSLGNALREQRRLDEALASYESSLKSRPEYVDAHWNRALIWMLQGNLERAWPEYEWRWRLKSFGKRVFQQPRWDGAPLAGRIILLHAEQGLGDTLQFVRYAPLVKERGGTVVVECQRPLARLLTSCPGIDRVVPQGDPLPEFDVQVPLLSLPRLFGTAPEDVPANVPYLRADPLLVERWRRELADVRAFKVGVAWKGSARYRADPWRSIPLGQFAPLAEVPGVQLYSLQKGPGSEQVRQVVDRFTVIDLGARLDEVSGPFMDTAALLASLDLVVTCDSALGHLAGGLGTPVWVALPFVPDWRWGLKGDTSPWYPSMRLFRQEREGDWEGVFERLAAALQEVRVYHGNRVAQ